LNETIVEVSDWKLDVKAHQVGFTAACCAVALIHLLIFLFYRRSLENLYFAIFTTGCAILTYAPFTSIGVVSPLVSAAADLSFKLGLVIVGIFGLRFLYGLFYPAIPRQFWVFLAGGVLCALLSWTVNVRAVYVYVVFALFEMFRVIVIAVLNKRDGSWIIGLGCVAFVLGCTYQILMEFQWVPILPVPFEWPYMAGILAMLISMSFYLARSVAKTSLELSQQLVQVKELSDKTIEQERLAREQEVARKLLVQEVAHKARELEEARKLQQALADLEKAHRELRDTQAQLVQSEKMATMGMLVAGVAHEINTPVGAITSMHNTLVRAVDRLKESFAATSKPQGDAADLDKSLATIDDANKVIQSASERVIAIVRRLRSFARLDEAELKKVDIHEGIEDTLSLIAHELKHGVEVVREFGDVPPISCFPSQLNQVFLNLFINAKQAMQGRGKIIIKTSRADGHLRIDISDTGPGIPKHELARIFDPGYTTKGVGVGTGLGLSICYQIIQDHHGEITASSETGKGATLTITLPLDLDSLLNAEQNSDGKA
jgi:signal transduction histidine kinase